ncbi:MAG: universal stress protein [Betaproteobacteria bacterium]
MTAQFQRLLLATEHTDFDVGAERVAFELARRHGLPLAVVVPMVSNPEYEAAAPQLVARAERDVADRVAGLRDAAKTAGIDIAVRVRRGAEPWREIVAEATARNADLIVVRRRGKRSFLSNLMLGEMVGNVVMHAPCSVLLVPRACELWSKRVLAGVDGSPGAATVAATAAAIAQGCGLPLTIVGVAVHDTAESRATAEASVDAATKIAVAAGAAVGGRVVTGRPHEGIAAVAAEVAADLVVVGRRGETSTLKRLLLGGTARGVVGLANYPVLVVKI